jgi:histidine triad (HIT) family protein
MNTVKRIMLSGVILLSIIVPSCLMRSASAQSFLDGSQRVPRFNETFLKHDCVFCNIIRGTEPAKIIAENNDVLVFESIHPRHASHWLIIPKKHIKDLKSVTDADVLMVGKLLQAAGTLANQLQKPQACNIALNEGKEAGQTVFHMHIHFYSDSSLLTKKPTL